MPSKRAIGAVVATVVVAAAVIAGFALQARHPPRPATRRASNGTSNGTSAGPSARVGTNNSASTGTSAPATFPGPDGTEARWVIQENDKPGTTAWEIHGPHGGISGFASQVYAQPGQKVTLSVSTTGRPAPWSS